jgi:putative two-component system response regulator
MPNVATDNNEDPAALNAHISQLEEKITQLEKLQNGIVSVVADIAEYRGRGTGAHIERTAVYLKILIKAMLARGKYTIELSGIDPDMLCCSARLYDVGKIVIPETVLNKPGKLTNEEFELMKTHAVQGERIIDKIISIAGNDDKFLHNAKLFAGYHHERWDGKGYPRGLDRLNIPLQGRIMAIIDVYSALVSERPYKQAFTGEEAEKIIMDSTGEMFDPLIAEVFYDAREQFRAV